jgi:hypothetical protein
MPVGVGIVGFCAQEAVSLAISDRRRTRASTRTSARSWATTPSPSSARPWSRRPDVRLHRGHQQKGTSHFTDTEVAILAYVAHQGAKYLEQTGG